MPCIDSKASILERRQRKLLDQLSLLKVILDITYASHAGSGAGYRIVVSQSKAQPRRQRGAMIATWYGNTGQ